MYLVKVRNELHQLHDCRMLCSDVDGSPSANGAADSSGTRLRANRHAPAKGQWLSALSTFRCVPRQWLLMVGALSGAGMRGRYSEIPQVIRQPALPNPTAPGLPGARCSPCLRPALAHGKGAERQRLQGTSLDADLMRAAHQPELQH
jgi:hypothetical protein